MLKEENLKEINKLLAEHDIKDIQELKYYLTDPLYHFSKKEAKFRLEEFHGIENPSDEMVDEVADIIFNDTEMYIDYGALDELISDYLKEVNAQ